MGQRKLAYPVFELHLKLAYFRKDPDCLAYRKRDGSDEPRDWKTLGDDVGLKWETLRASVSGQKNEITPNLADGLAAFFGFSVDWPEWRKGTAAAFKERYRRDVLNITPVFEMAAAAWHRHLSHEANNRMASLWVGIASQGHPQELHVELACQPAEVPGQRKRFLIRRGILLAELTGAETSGLAETQAYLDAYVSRPSRFPVRIELGGRRDAQSWEFETDGVAIGNHSISPICKLVNVVSGAHAVFSFFIYSKHLEIQDDAASPVGADTEDDAVVSTDGKALGHARKAILKLLHESALGERVKGHIVLAVCELVFGEQAGGRVGHD